MKRLLLTVLLSALLVVVFSGPTFSQMDKKVDQKMDKKMADSTQAKMGSMKDAAGQKMADSAQAKMEKMTEAQAKTGKMTEAQGGKEMMNTFSNQTQTMNADFAALQKHFNQMNQIKDMAQLQKEMAKHQEMMAQLQTKMTEHQKYCQTMMTSTETTKPVTTTDKDKK